MRKEEKLNEKEKKKDRPKVSKKSKSFKEQQEKIRTISSVINAKIQMKAIECERLKISSRKLEIPREHFMQR